MTDIVDPEEEAPKKASKMPLIIGIVLALLGGGGGFMAVSMGLLGGGSAAEESHEEDVVEEGEAPTGLAVSFVPLDPLVISMNSGNERRLLRFVAQIETLPEYVEELTTIKPRIVDVLNGYLRAVEMSDLEDPTALVRLRGQMLRRVQVVAGEGKVRDILIMEFVID